MWLCMCVCGCWLWSVRQGWKDYGSGNNCAVCMGNLLWFVSMNCTNLEPRGWRNGNEWRSDDNEWRGDQKERGVKRGWNRKSIGSRKIDSLSLVIKFFSIINSRLFPLSRSSSILRHTLEIPLHCSLDSVNPYMQDKQNINLISSFEMKFSFKLTTSSLCVGLFFF